VKEHIGKGFITETQSLHDGGQLSLHHHRLAFVMTEAPMGRCGQVWLLISNPGNGKRSVREVKENVATPLRGKCEVATHTPENGTWESSATPETLKFDYRGQNTLHWGKCLKWPCMSHLDIFNTSYGRKKGRKSKWQFDPRPLKVRNWPDPDVCKWSVTHRWKALNEGYKFVSDLVLIRGQGEKLWAPKALGVQIGTVSGLHFGSPEKKCHSDASATVRCIEYYMGEGSGFPRVWAVVSQVSPRLPVACPRTKSV